MGDLADVLEPLNSLTMRKSQTTIRKDNQAIELGTKSARKIEIWKFDCRIVFEKQSISVIMSDSLCKSTNFIKW